MNDGDQLERELDVGKRIGDLRRVLEDYISDVVRTEVDNAFKQQAIGKQQFEELVREHAGKEVHAKVIEWVDDRVEKKTLDKKKIVKTIDKKFQSVEKKQDKFEQSVGKIIIQTLSESFDKLYKDALSKHGLTEPKIKKLIAEEIDKAHARKLGGSTGAPALPPGTGSEDDEESGGTADRDDADRGMTDTYEELQKQLKKPKRTMPLGSFTKKVRTLLSKWLEADTVVPILSLRGLMLLITIPIAFVIVVAILFAISPRNENDQQGHPNNETTESSPIVETPLETTVLEVSLNELLENPDSASVSVISGLLEEGNARARVTRVFDAWMLYPIEENKYILRTALLQIGLNQSGFSLVVDGRRGRGTLADLRRYLIGVGEIDQATDLTATDYDGFVRTFIDSWYNRVSESQQ